MTNLMLINQSFTRSFSRMAVMAALLGGALFFSPAAQAGPLYVIENGVTGDGSSFDGDPIAPGTPFHLVLTFESPADPHPEYSLAIYSIEAFTLQVGNTTYTPANLADLGELVLFDSREGNFGPSFITWITGNGEFDWAPRWYEATPAFLAGSPTPTVFTQGDNNPVEMHFATTLGGANLTLIADPNVDINGRISDVAPVPEPSTFALSSLLLGGFGAIGVFKRLKQNAAAA
ncbi:MAG: hypothetical protein NT069_21710 [Planctomycetota bacterium]|nr:hypothetical protein [Planctomycetota bacterium]